jgi:hypothetical protein
VLLNRIKRMRRLRRQRLVLLMLSCGVDVRIVRPWVLLFHPISCFPSHPDPFFPLSSRSTSTPKLAPLPFTIPLPSLVDKANDRAPIPKKKEKQQEQCPTPSSLHSRRTRGRVTKVSSKLSEKSSRVSPLFFGIDVGEVADNR